MIFIGGLSNNTQATEHAEKAGNSIPYPLEKWNGVKGETLAEVYGAYTSHETLILVVMRVCLSTGNTKTKASSSLLNGSCTKLYLILNNHASCPV
jgi:hypothetical protein